MTVHLPEAGLGQRIAASYDQVPYPSFSYEQTHPDRLATLATLLGMKPAPVERCRVLELGCGSGGNLVPMAYALPESAFVGIDLSARHVAAGRGMVETLGLRNVSLEQLSILDVGPAFGEFDYIVAHGVFSWVPREVQEKILETCKRNLAPHGIAYVSYNTYPGWHMLGAIREMMLYHTRRLSDPSRRAAAAKGLLAFLSGAASAETSGTRHVLGAYAAFLKQEADRLGEEGDSFLLHDELETVNEPVYFHDFIARAERHGLQYLVEAEFRSAMADHLTEQVSAALREMAGDLVEMEQYMDFVRNRTFRQTLLCHAEAAIDRVLTPARVGALHAASHARTVSTDPDIPGPTVEKFQAGDGAVLATDHPASKAAMVLLAERWPQAVPFEELLVAARARLGLDPRDESGLASDRYALAGNLLRAYSYSGALVQLRTYSPPAIGYVSQRPVASAVARLQAQESTRVTNLHHQRVSLDPMGSYLLPLLDGSRDRDALIAAFLSGPIASGAMALREESRADESGQGIAAILGDDLDLCLEWLMRAALLVG